MRDLFNDIFEGWFDSIINNIPLINREENISSDIQDAIILNQQIINNMYSIRRFLEMDDTNQIYNNEIDESLPRQLRQRRSRETDVQTINNYINLNNSISYRRNRLTQNQVRTTRLEDIFENMLNTFLNNEIPEITQFEDIKVTISEKEFEKLETLEISDELLQEYIDKNCNICCENYKKYDKITKLKCNHLFHTECLRNWLCKEKVTCPTCRNDVRVSK